MELGQLSEKTAAPEANNVFLLNKKRGSPPFGKGASVCE
jgi:hypothetical protein